MQGFFKEAIQERSTRQKEDRFQTKNPLISSPFPALKKEKERNNYAGNLGDEIIRHLMASLSTRDPMSNAVTLGS